MARYSGKVGYSESIETSPGVWTSNIVERSYFGEIPRNVRRWENEGEKLNDDLIISVVISIVSDAYAEQNFHAIKYATWMNNKWKVTSVDVSYPRLRLTLGGIYNE